MRKGEMTRAKMVQTASTLIERQGYAATGLKQVLSESGCPRGSLYFHFPGGKEELATAVVKRHSETFGQALSAIIDQCPSALVAAQLSIEGLAQRLEASECESGCPVTAIAFEMSSRSEVLRRAARDAFESWTTVIAARLVQDGLPPTDAHARARALLSAIEGALILSRAYGGRGPLDDVKATLPLLLAI